MDCRSGPRTRPLPSPPPAQAQAPGQLQPVHTVRGLSPTTHGHGGGGDQGAPSLARTDAVGALECRRGTHGAGGALVRAAPSVAGCALHGDRGTCAASASKIRHRSAQRPHQPNPTPHTRCGQPMVCLRWDEGECGRGDAPVWPTMEPAAACATEFATCVAAQLILMHGCLDSLADPLVVSHTNITSGSTLSAQRSCELKQVDSSGKATGTRECEQLVTQTCFDAKGERTEGCAHIQHRR
jgi:hypothetical protein